MFIEYCEKCTIRIDAACYMDPQNAAKYCRKCGTNNPALVPFDPNEKANSGKSSGTRIKTPSGTRLKVTSGTRLKSLGESPSTPTTAASIDNSNPPDSFNKHVGNMAFYFCEKCGRRLSEVDLSQGLAKNKQLKGVYCASCSVGVNTMEMDAINLQEVLNKSGGSAAYKTLHPDPDPKLTQAPHASHSHKPSPGTKKKSSASPSLFPALPLAAVAIFIVIIILMSKSTDDSSANATPKKSATPNTTLVAESDVAKKLAEQESVRRAAEEKAQEAAKRAAEEKAALERTRQEEPPSALTQAAREEQAMKEMQELRAQREAKLKEAQANAVQQALTPNPQNTSQVETTWTPKELNPTAWYDAADASTITAVKGSVSQWADKSGNNYHVTQENGSKKPTTNSRQLNGLNVMDFDGGDILMNVSFTFSSLNVSYVQVFKSDIIGVKAGTFIGFGKAERTDGYIRNSSASTTLRGYGNRNPDQAEVYFDQDTNAHIVTYVKDGTSGRKAWQDGTERAGNTNTTTTFISQRLALGAAMDDSTYCDGFIAETIFFDSAISTDARQKLEGYLSHKWGLQDKLPADHPYKITPPLIPVNPTATTTPLNALKVETNWTPNELNPAAWYDASDASTITHNGGAVSQWKDKSGNGRDATQTNAKLQPTTGSVSINGKNALNFPGDAAKVLTTSFTQLTTASIYLVVDANKKGVRSNNCPLGASTSFEKGGTYITLQLYNNADAYHAVHYGANTTIPGTYLNGTYQAVDHGFNPCIISHQGTSLKTQNLEYRIGASTNNKGEQYSGTIGEIIICNADHDAATRQKIEGYLAHKWGLQDKLPADHPYKTTPPQNK